MKTAYLITALAVTTALQGATLYFDDFDTNIGGAATSSGMTTTVIDSTTVPALGAGRGNVTEVDISTGGQWGAFNVPGGAIALPAGTVAGVDTYTLSMDVFIPSTTTMAAGDSSSVIMRLNGTTPDYFAGGQVRNYNGFFDQAANQGTWVTISSGVELIPAVDNTDGVTPVTSLLPIFSIRDASPEGAAGTWGYVDNLSLTVTESIPEPSTSLFAALACGLAFIRRRR